MQHDDFEAKLEYYCKDVHEPTKGTEGSAAYDLYCPKDVMFNPGLTYTICLNIAFKIPRGYHIMLYPRSSMYTKLDLIGEVGVIDEDYTDFVHAMLRLSSSAPRPVMLHKGDRIYQFMLRKSVDYEIVALDRKPAPSDTRDGGLGSTGI